MWPGCSHGERPIRGTGDGREAKEESYRRRRLRYKISALPKGLKLLTMHKAYCNLRYKISGATNRLF